MEPIPQPGGNRRPARRRQGGADPGGTTGRGPAGAVRPHPADARRGPGPHLRAQQRERREPTAQLRHRPRHLCPQPRRQPDQCPAALLHRGARGDPGQHLSREPGGVGPSGGGGHLHHGAAQVRLPGPFRHPAGLLPARTDARRLALRRVADPGTPPDHHRDVHPQDHHDHARRRTGTGPAAGGSAAGQPRPGGEQLPHGQHRRARGRGARLPVWVLRLGGEEAGCPCAASSPTWSLAAARQVPRPGARRPGHDLAAGPAVRPRAADHGVRGGGPLRPDPY